MPLKTSFVRLRTLALAGGAALAVAAGAQTAAPAPSVSAGAWPAKPIRVVVGFAPGGSTDVMARILAQSLSESLGQTVLIDNKPGASGNISAAEVARAVPDGHTFLIAPTSVETANPSLFKSTLLPSRDLTPVATVGRTQMYLVAKPQLPARDVRELVALTQGKPGSFSYASAGTGTPPHLACELFKQATGADVQHVPYRGAAPALQDVLSGQADFVCDPGIAFPHIRTGKARLLGIVSAKRSPFFPDVPTVAEQGFPGANLDIWFGLWAPNGTPPEVLARMNGELAKALALPSVKSRYADLGAEPVAMSTPEFRKLLAEEGAVLSALIAKQKIVVD
ncbi:MULTISPECIES: tripartite tricarboxylate transporter substrate binding protein [unclassified Variovorax]|uniref:Bug family tripartite tricarboxylate transporter substrate binding protein n=1 Tax=unclassified Variovorax TaxID=663243 RepID=UPI002576F481|nr:MULTISPECIES: tripartite tricarboxylate transporter substrate binding protein [unclassified Variovorax]MDM0086506.1 tripartite tricarboxylate transporter substrate binding protein [Variovorax sp. J22G40]MDM0145237.1 tripartite tricarboxylate transporter substrate binding protein [Variovorax sp. J2P1-31]